MNLILNRYPFSFIPFQSTANSPYAGVIRRFIAGIVDFVTCGCVMTGIVLILASILAVFAVLFKLSSSDYSNGMKALGLCLNSIGFWAYYAGLESSPLQATLGKKLLGMKVTTLEGKPLSLQQASIRYGSKFLTVLTAFLGFFLMCITPRRQSLHDWAASCLVCRV